ncbi:MAG TPA: hypothetical protein VK365_05805 [Nocardioidaceae bacterium]|jgi:H+/gluconate symporter-like permease|nr:hypothetical protein [Nocardioidaceae bacterium]
MVPPGAATLAIATSLDIPLGTMLLWGIPFGIVVIVISILVHTLLMCFTWNHEKDDDPLTDPEHTGEIAGFGGPPGAAPSGEQAAIAHDPRATQIDSGGATTAVARDPQLDTVDAVADDDRPQRRMPLLVALLPLLVPVLLIVAQTTTSMAGAEVAGEMVRCSDIAIDEGQESVRVRREMEQLSPTESIGEPSSTARM